jgi:predicted permease
MESFRQDVVFAVRQLRRSRGFALTVVMTLALGIGANTAIFSVVNGTMLMPLPYPEADRLVYVTAVVANAGISATHLADADFADLRERGRLAELAALDETVVLPLTDAQGSETVVISRTTANFFDVLGVPPLLGRAFRPEDGVPIPQGATRPPRPVIVSHGLWQRRFGGDPDVIGRVIGVNNFPATIIGVMPAHFEMLLPAVSNIGSDIDLWWPIRWDHAAGSRQTTPGLGARVVGRLHDGVTLQQMQEEARVVAGDLRAQFPFHRDMGVDFGVAPLHDGVVGTLRGTMVMFVGAVGFVLLIACANVANLLLARSAGRRTELAVRAALGADRRRIIRQVFTESALLSAMGAVAGVALAAVGINLLKALRPADLPRVDAIGLDPAVLLFSVGLAVLATLIYGIVPALQYSRGGAVGALGERAVTAGRGQRRVQSVLAVTEVALSIVLLTGAMLMVRSFRELQQMPLGFDMDRLVTLRTNTITSCRWTDGNRQCDLPQIEEDIERRLAALPGVAAVGSGFPLPMNGVYDRVAQYAPDALRDDEGAKRDAFFRTVSPTYLPAMGIDLLAGRHFTRMDNDTLFPVVIVDEELARRQWPGEDPVGKKLALFGWSFDRRAAFEVIGVARFVPQWNHRGPRPTVYVPRAFYRSIELSVAVRASGDPAAMVSSVRRELAAVHPDLPLEFVQMPDLISRAMAPTRFVLTLLSIFSVMALVLASIGLYGVLAYTVRQRTREIGIRIAFGAQGSNVVREIIRAGTAMALVGTALGLSGSAMLGGLLERHLFGVTAGDPFSFVATAALVLGVAVLASYVPARRAARVDPMVALRSE